MKDLDYVIRNLSVMDGEQQRLVDNSASTLAAIPAEFRDLGERTIKAIDNDDTNADQLCDELLAKLMPLVSDPELFKNDFAAWEDKLYGG
jgi:hypothetical protein